MGFTPPNLVVFPQPSPFPLSTPLGERFFILFDGGLLLKFILAILSLSLLFGCSQPQHQKDVPHRNNDLRDHACQIHLCED